jgi:hypothetical protein
MAFLAQVIPALTEQSAPLSGTVVAFVAVYHQHAGLAIISSHRGVTTVFKAGKNIGSQKGFAAGRLGGRLRRLT